jgi:hypothetical protein
MDILKDYNIKEICDFTIYKLTDEEIEERKKNKAKEREKWFKIEPIYMPVSKEDFTKFIKTYPRKLDCDVCGICDPAMITYNDFELANRWPYSIVAKTWAYSDNPTDYCYEPPEERSYYILVNYEEVFNSKTGYKE